ncbi:unnamed protein product [Amoebophrya sp. A25]|nr:unnamed protein product [Amoebophrya sp. A25]|eukprot:GSA25T00017477001.1
MDRESMMRMLLQQQEGSVRTSLNKPPATAGRGQPSIGTPAVKVMKPQQLFNILQLPPTAGGTSYFCIDFRQSRAEFERCHIHGFHWVGYGNSASETTSAMSKPGLLLDDALREIGDSFLQMDGTTTIRTSRQSPTTSSNASTATGERGEQEACPGTATAASSASTTSGTATMCRGQRAQLQNRRKSLIYVCDEIVHLSTSFAFDEVWRVDFAQVASEFPMVLRRNDVAVKMGISSAQGLDVTGDDGIAAFGNKNFVEAPYLFGPPSQVEQEYSQVRYPVCFSGNVYCGGTGFLDVADTDLLPRSSSSQTSSLVPQSQPVAHGGAVSPHPEGESRVSWKINFGSCDAQSLRLSYGHTGESTSPSGSQPSSSSSVKRLRKIIDDLGIREILLVISPLGECSCAQSELADLVLDAKETCNSTSELVRATAAPLQSAIAYLHEFVQLQQQADSKAPQQRILVLSVDDGAASAVTGHFYLAKSMLKWPLNLTLAFVMKKIPTFNIHPANFTLLSQLDPSAAAAGAAPTSGGATISGLLGNNLTRDLLRSSTAGLLADAVAETASTVSSGGNTVEEVEDTPREQEGDPSM